jgi:hypothetical protein
MNEDPLWKLKASVAECGRLMHEAHKVGRAALQGIGPIPYERAPEQGSYLRYQADILTPRSVGARSI